MSDKSLPELVQEAVAELHKKYDQAMDETKKLGTPMAETKATIDRCNERIDELEVKLQRQTVPAPGSPDAQTEESKARTAAFFKFVRHGDTGLTPEERKALVEDTTGQILITPELETEIERTLPKITVIRPLATVRSIGKDRLKVRSISEVAVGWGKLETGAEIPESSQVPGTPTYQYAEDLYGLAKIGEDELADSDFNLQALLAESFTRAIAEAEDLAFIKGAGHDSEEPMGITIEPILVAAGEDVSTTLTAAIEDFMAVMYACPAQHRRNGVWIVNSATELAIRQLRAVGTVASTPAVSYSGQFLWQPSIIEGRPNTFLGRPIYNQDDLDILTGDTSVVAIFGDIKAGYRIIDRAGITLQRLVELYAESGLVGFKVHKRVGGGAIKPANKAIVLLKNIA